LSPETFRTALALSLAAALLAASGCRQNMHNQHKLKPYRGSEFFADGMGARPLPAHTVAHGDLQEGAFFTGVDAAGAPLAALPVPLTHALLLRGQERFNVFCSPCHGRLGDGRGMIVQRGFKQPPSYLDPRLRAVPVGHFFNVMTAGFGQMASYAPQVPPADRWAIAAYIRALQLSQKANLADLTPEQRKTVAAALAAPHRPEPKAHEVP
jgi:mono/diheme cytochrome c family protein